MYHHLPKKTSEYTTYKQQSFPTPEVSWMDWVTGVNKHQLNSVWRRPTSSPVFLTLWLILLLFLPPSLVALAQQGTKLNFTNPTHPELFVLYFSSLFSPECILALSDSLVLDLSTDSSSFPRFIPLNMHLTEISGQTKVSARSGHHPYLPNHPLETYTHLH